MGVALLWFGISLLSLTSAFVCAQTDLPCDPTTAVAKQSRTEMKHRKPASKGTHIEITNISELRFETPDDIRDKATRTSESPIDDCDYHLELSAIGGTKTTTRVIAEIPDDAPFASTRQALLGALRLTDRQTLQDRGDVTLGNPVNLRLTGFALFDAFHYTLSFDQQSLENASTVRHKRSSAAGIMAHVPWVRCGSFIQPGN